MPAVPTQLDSEARREVILGVDPGLQITGWGVLDVRPGRGAAARAICDTIRTVPRAPTAARLRTILEGMLAVIDAEQPQVVALEQPFVHLNPRSALAIGQAQAAAMIAAAQRGLPVFTYAPREVKQAVTGDGQAEKSAVATALRLQLDAADLPPSTDATDALAVAFCHHVRTWFTTVEATS